MKQESYIRVATYLWTTVATNSTTGNWYISKSDVEETFGITLTDGVCNEILNVMYKNFDVLECEYLADSQEFDITIGTSFVIQYDDTNCDDYVDTDYPSTYFEAEEYVKPKVKLNLTAICDEEKDILEYLERNASEALVQKINKKPERPMVPCLAYCYNEARNLCENGFFGNSNKCKMVKDQTVYGWAVHYYEDVEAEEDIAKAKQLLKKLEAEEKAKSEPKTETKPTVKVKPQNVAKPKPTAEKLVKAYEQLSLLKELGL